MFHSQAITVFYYFASKFFSPKQKPADPSQPSQMMSSLFQKGEPMRMRISKKTPYRRRMVMTWISKKMPYRTSHSNHNPFLVSELIAEGRQTACFTWRQLQAATNNFNEANKLGEGGFGAVFKGELSDGTIIAVKQLSSKSRQGNREFVNEIGMISGLDLPNLVKLYGLTPLLLCYLSYGWEMEVDDPASAKK